ncbi:MAG: tetratricopeptide repeat protein [Wenzhouxiangella sp.]|nr:tetratricopeptide repeat protein [Wenzhouxiangella sp.]
MRIEFENFQLDTEQKQVSGPDGPVNLRPQTFAVLCHLIEQAPAVVSRDQLLDAVWGHQATSVSSVAQTIKELRQALGDSSSEPRLIATRRRLGYQFIASVRAVSDDGEASEDHDTAAVIAPPVSELPADRLSRYWPWPAAAAALVTLLVVALWWIQTPSPVGDRGQLPTLAVAGMVNSSEDPELNWIGPALETYLGHALVELGGFRVLAVDSAAAASESGMEGIDYLVEGRYLSAGVDGSRLLASLRRPGSNEILTSLESGRSDWDVASMSIDMAAAIRDRLGFDAPPEADSAAIRARLPRRPGSQRAYFAAVQALDRFDAAAALNLIEQAREHEPDNPRLDLFAALAHAHRGDLASARKFSERAMTATRLWPRRDRLDIEATAAMLAFDWQRAADRLQALTQFFPDSGSSRRLVRALGQSGRFNDAAEALRSLRLKQPEDPRLALLAAELAALQKQHEQQLEAAREAADLVTDPSTPAVRAAAQLSQTEALIELGDWSAAREQLGLLTAGDSGLSDNDHARALLQLARLEFLQGDLEPALQTVDLAEQLFEAIPHPVGLAESALLRGSIHERAGRLNDSIAALEQALTRFETVADPRRVARAHVQLGNTLMRANRPDEAIDHLHQAARSFRALGDRQGEGAALINHATLLARSGRLPDAEPIFQRALEAFEDAGDLRGQAMALGNLAAIAGDRRDMTRSIELAEESLGIFEMLGARTDIARVSYNLALIHRRQGELLSAERRIRQAGEAFAEQGAVLMQMRALTTLGAILVGMGRFEELEAVMQTIETLDIEDPAETAVAHIVRGEHALIEGDPEGARNEFQRAHDLMTGINAENHMLVTEMHLARADLAHGQAVAAEQTARRLAFAFGEIRMVNRQIDTLLLLAEALIEQDRHDDAAGVLGRADELLVGSPDAEQTLRLGLLRSRVAPPELARERLAWVEETASRQGFLPLMQRARGLLTKVD